MRPILRWTTGSALALSLLASGQVLAVPDFTFNTPDAPLPVGPGTGLSGQLWSNGAIAPVNSLAAARAYIGANAPESLFVSTVIDYPNGASNSASTAATINSALGVDAGSLSNPGVGANAVLNSILLMDGFLRIDNDGTTLNLGLGSDDGSELLIQGTQVLNNDGIHAFPGGGAGPVELLFTTAGLYEIEVLFFESQQVLWGLELCLNSGNCSSSGSRPVPTSLLYPSTGVPEPGTVALLGMSLLGFGLARRRNCTHAAA